MERKLLEACEKGDFNRAHQLISQGSNPKSARGRSGWTPVHWGCLWRDLSFVRTLVEDHNCDPECRTTTLSVISRHYNMYSGTTPLHLASHNGELEAVKYLVGACCCNKECTDGHGMTPLHKAAWVGHLEVVRYLTGEVHCNPECKTKAGYTPLHLASFDLAPLDWSSFTRKLKVVMYLVVELHCNKECTNNKGITPLHKAARMGWLETVKFLVGQCCSVECTDNDGMTPLHMAAENELLEVMEFLIGHHCNIECTDNNGWTPLHWAARMGRLETVKFLVRQCCNVECTDNNGWTPLHMAARAGHLEVVQYLTGVVHCDPECKSSDGETPLHLASFWESLEVVKYLVVECHCNVECTDNNGWTPLHKAARNGRLEMVKFLVEQCCNVECTDNNGRTSLHMAAEEGKIDVVIHLLKEAHCNPNCSCNDGHRPLSVTRSPEIIRQLLQHGADPKNDFESFSRYLPSSCPTQPAESIVKVFVVGDFSAGKTTLTEAIKTYAKSTGLWSKFINRTTKVTGVEHNTAGIVPHELESKRFGHITLYDFAGHKEFYASHDSILKNTLSGTSAVVFLVVTDLQKVDKGFHESVTYWLNFIENRCSSIDHKPHVIIIGSHADRISEHEKLRKCSILTSLQTAAGFPGLHFSGFVAMNCCYGASSSMSYLCHCLERSSEALRSSVLMSMRSHCFFVYLLNKYRDSPAILLNALLHTIGEKTESDDEQLLDFVPHTLHDICTSCDELNERGHVLFLKKPNDIENSWVVLDKTVLLSRVTGTVFAPEGFMQHRDLATSTGVVPFSKFATTFPDLNPNMIVQFLCHLEFCQEITDPEILHLLKDDHRPPPAPNDTPSTSERWFFFPSLVRVGAQCTSIDPTNEAVVPVWAADPDRFGYHCGWLLQCSNSTQFLTPRFLQVLILQLSFSFAFAPDTKEASDIPMLQRECTVWKNGLYWATRTGVEALVEVTNKRLMVLLRSLKGQEISCIRFRSAIIEKILGIRKEFCPKVSTSEHFLLPSDATQYPLKPIPELTLVTCTEIAKAVIEGVSNALDNKRSPRELQTLLHCEPYAHLGETILQELYNENSPMYTQVVRGAFLAESSHIDRVIGSLVPILTPRNVPVSKSRQQTLQVLQSWRSQTYQCLRKELDKFSIFAGRSPLAVAGVLPLHTEPTTLPEQHQGDDTVLESKPEMDELMTLQGGRVQVINEVAAIWEDLAYSLHFKAHDIANIKNNVHPFTLTAACREVLIMWLHGKRRKPVNWRTLLEALEDAGQGQLATELRAVVLSTKA